MCVHKSRGWRVFYDQESVNIYSIIRLNYSVIQLEFTWRLMNVWQEFISVCVCACVCV